MEINEAESPDVRAGPRFSWRRGLLWLALTIFFTAFMICFSQRHGRLLTRPFYDDVDYFCDALRRINVLDRQGISGFLRYYCQNPPRSPGYSFLAMASFLLLGNHEWAPYVANGLVVLILLLVVDYFMAGTRLLPRIGAALLVLTIPITGAAITEFRPDFFTGLVVATAILLMIQQPLQDMSQRKRWMIGLLWAGALLLKPTVLPQTLFLATAIFALQLLAARWAQGRSVPAALSWRRLLPLLLPSLLTIPHFMIAGNMLSDYVRRAMFGRDKDLWYIDGDWRVQAGFYLTGQSGGTMFGNQLLVLAIVVAIGLIVILYKGDRPARARAIVLLLALALAYAFPAINKTKNIFLALSFQFLLVLSAVTLVSEAFIWSRRPTVRHHWALAGGWLAVVAAILCAHWPMAISGGWRSASDPTVRATNRVTEDIYRTIEQDLAQDPIDHDALIYSSTTGYFDRIAVAYLALRDGISLHPMDTYAYFTGELDYHRAQMQKADIIIASEEGNGLAYDWLPSAKQQNQTLAFVAAMPRFDCLAAIPALHDKYYYVFRKRSLFYGLGDTAGLLPVEGPYPDLKLPQVRWGLAPATLIKLHCDSAETRELCMSAVNRGSVAHQKITVVVNGQTIAESGFPDNPSDVISMFLLLELQRGNNIIELRCPQSYATSRGPMTVLFDVLCIRSAYVKPPATAGHQEP